MVARRNSLTSFNTNAAAGSSLADHLLIRASRAFEGWLHHVVEKLPGQASMTPCCSVGGAILPVKGFRHGPASRGIGGGVAGFAS